MQKTLSLEVWSDIACPWCYVGKRRLEAALAHFPQRAQTRLRWRSFQLDPAAPRVQDSQVSYAERLGRKYGTTPAQAQQMIDRMVQTAQADGLRMDFSIIRPGNTFDAHRILHLARTKGLQNALKERLFRAYLCEGAKIGEAETLLALSVESGLDADDVQGVLSTDLYAEDVRADQDQARAFGISAVPFFLLGRRYGVSGAQPAELLAEALQKAWDEAASDQVIEGEVCGPDGCG
jgi:predicted DsbA family dithiol-disulfide isomerase